MNASEQFDYAFGLLEEPRRTECERELAADPALAERVERLTRSINRLVDDGETFEPPADLARRTLRLVGEHRRRPRRTFHDLVPVRVPFRWADVAVAAGIFLAALATLLPAVQRSRIQADQATCALNLRQIGTGLAQYAGTFHVYPYTNHDSSAPYAGTFAVMLNDAGYLHRASLLDCPSNGPGHVPDPLPPYGRVCEVEECAPGSSPCLRNVDYGYNLGYTRGGVPGPIPARIGESLPLLSDRPAYSESRRILEGNSPNHGGRGQNVLFTGGHVQWHSTRRVGPDDDVFLNAQHRPAPGIDPWDAVVVPGIFRFDGK
jgi:hypothetical protein